MDHDGRAVERLRALTESMRAFAETEGDFEALLETIGQHVTRLLADVSLIGLLSEDGQWLESVRTVGRDPDVVQAARAALDPHFPMRREDLGTTFDMIRTGQPTLMSHIAPTKLATAVAPVFAELVTKFGVCGFLSVPLKVSGRVIGGLALYRYRSESPPFDEADLAFATSIADHATLAICNARLLASLRSELVERRRAEESAQTFVALVENSTDFIAMGSFEGRVLFVNAAGRRLVGLGPEQDVTKLTLEDFHTETGLARRAIIRERGSFQGEGVLKHFNTGELIPVQVASFIARDVRGEPLCFATIQRDLRETHALESKLRQAQKLEAIGRLAGGVAHDFNNMLSVILGYASIAIDALPRSDPTRADIEEMKLAGERAAKLTHQLLTFSRQQVLEPKFLDVRQVVLGMQKMLSRLLPENIELSLVTNESGSILGDAGQLEQVVMNLAVNARDAMPNGGTLTIDVRNVEIDHQSSDDPDAPAIGSYVLLEVTDTGTGIDASAREQIFEPFFTTKESGRGTGLGLATVFGIVKQSRGTITVESEPERGTTFAIYLPRTDSEPSPLSPPRHPPTTLRGSETILVVEDDDQVRAVMRTILQRHGYVVLDAQNGGEAFLICEQHRGPIHLMLTDVVMPRMTGPELASRVMPLRPDMRVLFVSGYTDNRTVREAGNAFLQKPITPEALLRRVRVILDGPNAGHGESFVERVRAEVAAAMHGSRPNLEVIARALHASPRTVQRRLVDQGTNYGDVVESVRRELAERLVKEGRMTITEIAFSLGFADVSGFRRLYKRWTGVAPSMGRADPPGTKH